MTNQISNPKFHLQAQKTFLTLKASMKLTQEASPIQPATRIWTPHLNTIERKSLCNQYNHLSKQNLH
jgi:hypothetical protein